MRDITNVSLSHDPIHGYIPFTRPPRGPGEASECQVIDHPWVQRLRQIHQLQAAWYVFPTAEHTRFQHVIGAMHLASRAVTSLYDGLRDVCPEVPSRPYVESLMRMAGLLHDVGHGPYGHFFDHHFLAQYGLNHETLGARIIVDQLGDLLRAIRENPHGRLADNERLDPQQVAWLIQRPGATDLEDPPRWLIFLRSLLSGIYTIDNMDFVLRDAYMTGYSQRSFDLDRLLHYSFFSESGLTIHDRGMGALLRFMGTRSDLFRSIYFHRTVQAIEITLADLFADSKNYLFPGNPLDMLSDYQRFTEYSLIVDVSRWPESDDARQRALGERWTALLRRNIIWKMLCQRTLIFDEGDSECASIFSDAEMLETRLRQALPQPLRDIELRIDIMRWIPRPRTGSPAACQNYLYDSATQQIRPLRDDQLFRNMPVSQRICRVYGQSLEAAAEVAAVLDGWMGPSGIDDLTNM